jgi:hypothetical protein
MNNSQIGSRKLDRRAFSALMAGFSALCLPFSGLALHLLAGAPLTESQHAWMAVHTVLGVVFVVFAGWHVLINWRGLTNSIRKVYAGGYKVRREVWLALVILAILILLASGHAALAAGSI